MIAASPDWFGGLSRGNLLRGVAMQCRPKWRGFDQLFFVVALTKGREAMLA
jgi:hypothetical protein